MAEQDVFRGTPEGDEVRRLTKIWLDGRGATVPDLNDYERLTDDELADVVETLAKGQENPTRGIVLLEAARRLRSRIREQGQESDGSE